MLNYHSEGSGKPLLLLHGLFGHLDNLNILAQSLKMHYQVIRIDLRNHGLSPWYDEMNYLMMAQDVTEICQHLQLEDITLIGHSMGGKTAMALTALLPEHIRQLIVMDIAPVAYPTNAHGHQPIFAALQAVIDQDIIERRDVARLMKQFIHDEATIQFLLKSFRQGKWQFNVAGLARNATQIAGWQPLPAWHGDTLFIKGETSNYLLPEHKAAILAQFPRAKVHQIAHAGHNVHAEKPDSTIRAIRRFLQIPSNI